jgi:hypothetical protein
MPREREIVFTLSRKLRTADDVNSSTNNVSFTLQVPEQTASMIRKFLELNKGQVKVTVDVLKDTPVVTLVLQKRG